MREPFIKKRFTPEAEQLLAVCNKILKQYESAGYDLSLRQLYYQLVSKKLEQWEKARPLARELQDIQRNKRDSDKATPEEVERVLSGMGFSTGTMKAEIAALVEKMGQVTTEREIELIKQLSEIGTQPDTGRGES